MEIFQLLSEKYDLSFVDTFLSHAKCKVYTKFSLLCNNDVIIQILGNISFQWCNRMNVKVRGHMVNAKWYSDIKPSESSSIVKS